MHRPSLSGIKLNWQYLKFALIAFNPWRGVFSFFIENYITVCSNQKIL